MSDVLEEALQFYNLVEQCIQDNEIDRLTTFVPRLQNYSNLLSRVNDARQANRLNIDPHSLLNHAENLMDCIKHLSYQHHEDPLSLSCFLPSLIDNHGGPGRPRILISEAELSELHNAGLSGSCIAKIYGVSSKTVYRLKAAFNLEKRSTLISDSDLDNLLLAIIDEHPTAGYVYVWSCLKTRNIFVPFRRLKERMKLIDPVGVFQRTRGRLKRREYRVKGANYLWHMDGNEKLVHWRIYVHGCIDGFSRKIIYLQLSHCKKAIEVLRFFSASLKEHGYPLRVRGDRGKENLRVRDFMEAMESHVDEPFLFGRSVHNVRIERLWAEVNRVVTWKYKVLFLELEKCGFLDEHSILDLLCLSYIFFPRIDSTLQNFVRTWNNHCLRTCDSRTPNQLWLVNILHQKHSNNSSSPYHQTIRIIQNDFDSDFTPRENHSSEISRRLLNLSDELQEPELLDFLLIAERCIPNPLLEDSNHGVTLYTELRNCARMYFPAENLI